MTRTLAISSLAALSLALACLVNQSSIALAADETTEQRSELLVLAAASTTDAMEAISADFMRQHPQITVRTSFGASSALAKQIVAGAEADLFLSASREWAELLAGKQLIARQHDLLGNRLVVVVPAGSQLKLAQPADLVSSEVRRLALADPQAVPAGVYARQALETLKLWPQLESRVAAAADVRQALQFVATGSAEAGIVYASDVRSEPQVRIACEFDPALSASIRYPLVLLKRAEENPAALAFYDFLSSPAAKAVFEKEGFIVLPAEAGSEVAAAKSEAPAADAQAVGPAATGHWWFLTHDEWQALRLSFLVGVCAVAGSLPLAIATGHYLARSQSRGKWLLELLVNLPLVLPPVVTGYLLLMLFAPRGALGGALEAWFGVRIVFTWLGAAIAAAVVSFPLMVRAIRLAFQAVDPRLEMAARSLGAGRWDAFWSVTLPLARSGVLAGCLLGFARSLGEFGATIMIAGNIVGETQTIPLAIFSYSNRPGAEAQVWRLVGISIALAAIALLLSEWLERRYAARES
jgi:molybdate transport system permease protein